MTPPRPARAEPSCAPIGAILAGGRASRLGAVDKSLLPVGGRTILARVAGALCGGCPTLVLSANGDPSRFDSSGLPVVADSMPDHPGPLAGVLAVMDWTAMTYPAATHIVTAPGDTPFLPIDLVDRLLVARLEAGATIACACSGGSVHPIIALWPVALRDDLRQALVGEGLRKVGLFQSRYAIAQADWPAAPIDPFFNVNTPEDLATAEAIALARCAARRN